MVAEFNNMREEDYKVKTAAVLHRIGGGPRRVEGPASLNMRVRIRRGCGQ